MDALESIREIYEDIDSDEQIQPSKRFKSSESMNPGHDESIQSLPPTMEPSQPSPVDSLAPSAPMDTMESMRVMCQKTDPQEQIKPSKRFKSSGSKNLGHHRSTPSSPCTVEPSQPSSVEYMGPSPTIDAIETIREIYEKIDPAEQIDRLVSFVETQLHKMNTLSGKGSSSSEGWLDTLKDDTKLAAKTIDTISVEAEKLCTSDAVEALGSLTLKVVKGIGELHWVFMGLSVAVFAAESYISVSSTENEC